MTKQVNYEEMKELLLEGLAEEKRDVVSTLMDNTHKSFGKLSPQEDVLKESTATGSTTTGAISRYDQIFMPLIRRVVPAMLAMELVGVQPLNAPTGIVRTLRNVYGDDVSDSVPTQIVTDGDEANAQNIYDKYSLIASGAAYDSADLLNPFDQTVSLEGDRGNPMKLEVLTQRVDTVNRKLSAAWSLEADDDLNAYDGLSIESELIASLSDELLREMDRDMLGELTSLAGAVEALDFASIDGRYAGEKLTAMTIAFSNLSTHIATKLRRSGATWMVVSPRVLTGMKNANNSTFVPVQMNAYDARQSLMVGTFDGNINVYVDVHAETDSVLLGHKGSNLDTGFVYSPYIPLTSSGVVINPETLDKRMGMRTRYAYTKFTDTDTSLGNSADFYARATVANIQLGFTNTPTTGNG